MALYSDIETITILTNANHLHLKHDSTYGLGDFRDRLTKRPDANQKLLVAFDGLTDLTAKGAVLTSTSDIRDLDEEVFVNAMESLYSGTESSPRKKRISI